MTLESDYYLYVKGEEKKQIYCIFLNLATHVKISQLVTSLQTSCQQAVFALLIPSCQQVVPNLLTTCNMLDEIIRLVTRLF